MTHRKHWLFFLGFALLATTMSSLATAASITKDQTIDGVLANYEAFRRIQCLKVVYSLDFQALTKPPRFAFTHLEVVNLARDGAYRTHIKARGVRDIEEAKEERISTWDGKVGMTTRSFQTVTIESHPDNLLFYYRYYFDFLFYPDGSGRVMSHPGAVPAAQSEEWVPQVLARLRSEYSLRATPEPIDGHMCYVLERPGRDRIWVDASNGFAVRQREIDYPQKKELKARCTYTGFEQTAGFSHPMRIVREDYAPPIGKPNASAGAVSRFDLNVTSFTPGPATDSDFRIAIPPGATVLDGIRKMTYTRVASANEVIPKTLEQAEAILQPRLSAWEYILIGVALVFFAVVGALIFFARWSAGRQRNMSQIATSGLHGDRIRPGFTLIETVVVIGIVGILLALLLAGVQRVREGAARAHCQNNLRQLGLALVHFESQKGCFPRLKLSEEQSALGFSWAVDLLPFLEQDTLYRRLDLHRESFEYPNAEVAGVTLPVFQCPSTENPRLADYRIIGIDVPNPLGTTDYVPTAAVLPHLVSANPPRTALYGLMENLVNVHTSEVTDGLSNTIAFTEDAGRPQYWRQGTRVPNREPLPSSAWVDPLNAIFVGGAKSDPNLIVNFVNSDEIYSFHPAGANAVMADGSVRLLSVRASPRLVVALITRAGGESVPPD